MRIPFCVGIHQRRSGHENIPNDRLAGANIACMRVRSDAFLLHRRPFTVSVTTTDTLIRPIQSWKSTQTQPNPLPSTSTLTTPAYACCSNTSERSPNAFCVVSFSAPVAGWRTVTVYGYWKCQCCCRCLHQLVRIIWQLSLNDHANESTRYTIPESDRIVFLVNVVRVLCNKLHPGTAQLAPLALQKALRATLILVPLFGLHYVLLPFRPDAGSSFDKVYQILSALLISMQV